MGDGRPEVYAASVGWVGRQAGFRRQPKAAKTQAAGTPPGGLASKVWRRCQEAGTASASTLLASEAVAGVEARSRPSACTAAFLASGRSPM